VAMCGQPLHGPMSTLPPTFQSSVSKHLNTYTVRRPT